MKTVSEFCLKRQNFQPFAPLFNVLAIREEVVLSGGVNLRDLASPTSLYPPEPEPPSSPPSPEQIIIARGAHGESVTLRHLINYLSTLGLA